MYLLSVEKCGNWQIPMMLRCNERRLNWSIGIWSSCSMFFFAHYILNAWPSSGLAFKLLYIILFNCVLNRELYWSLVTYCLLFSGLLCMKTYRSLFFFFPHFIPLSQHLFLRLSVYILCLYVCLSVCVCACVHAHIICTPVFVRHGIISVVHWFNENGWNDIQSSDIKHQRPVELWCIDRLQEQRERWLRGWKSWKKEIDEADKKTSSQGSAANSVWGLRLLGLCQSGYGGKVAPLRKRVESKRERERCKGMCGALRVWMIGEINQVPSWPSCQSIAFPSAPLQYNSVNGY